MDIENIVAVLKQHEHALRAQGVTALSLFGSVARGDARPDSDVDVLVDIAEERRFSLLDHAGLQLFLSDMLDREAHLQIRDSLSAKLRLRIEPDEARVF